MNLDQMCADALKRINWYLNLAAARHKYELRGKRPVVKESLTPEVRK